MSSPAEAVRGISGGRRKQLGAPPPVGPTDAETVRAALAALENDRGRITPAAVVGLAADPASPLHRFFEWDDSRAAYEHRLSQARALIRSVEVRVSVESRVLSTVHYVRDPEAAPTAQGYVSLPRLLTEEDNARAVVHMELRRVLASLSRAEAVAEALGLRDEITDVISTVERVISRASRTRT